MNYIKVNSNGKVSIGGKVATKKMLDEGWFQYKGEIPKIDDTQYFTLDDNGKLVVNTDKELARKKAKQLKNKKLNNNTYTLSDGSVYQVRPQDFSNFQTAIQLGADTDWILADNTVRHTTVDELKEILSNGIKQVKAIYQEYIDTLKSIGE